jgi:hypothetical protein
MRYIVIILLFAALLGSHTKVRAQDAMSVWDTTGIVIDGRIKEWPSFFRFYISGAKLQFDFYNDSSNIFLCVKAVDMEAQSRLMHAGLNLWFDPTGKKKQKIGITFPMKLERAAGDAPKRIRANSDPSTASSEERSRASRLRENVLFAQAAIKVTGMMAVTEPMIPLQNKYGIEIAYDWDSLSILCVEYKIPLALILQHPVVPTDFLRPIGLGIVVGALETQPPASHAEGGQNSGGRGGGMGGSGGGMGGGGGGRGGSGRGGNSSQNNLATDRFNTDNAEQKVWLKVHLETKPVK